MSIKDYIRRELSEDEQAVALSFVDYLEENGMSFYKDSCEYWRDKVYYWVQYKDECVCFISINNPDEPENSWTVWSDDIATELLADVHADDEMKELAWRHVDHCGHCGSCGGGRKKVIFGREFYDICGCTFRIDDPSKSDIAFMQKIIEIRISVLDKL